MYLRTKESVLRTLTNMRGWRSARPLIVFESDDWGAMRMPNRQTYEAMRQQGVPFADPDYDRLDCLETRADLEALFEVVGKHQSQVGSPVCFTFNMVLGNPDFDAIEASNFQEYVHQSLFSSYQETHGEDLSPLWQEAFEACLMRAQFHAREHLNVDLWMNDLRSGEESVRTAFKYRYFGLARRQAHGSPGHYLAAYRALNPHHLQSILEILREGLSLFERYFGFRSRTMIACNYIWPRALEYVAADAGISLMQGQRGHLIPAGEKKSTLIKRHYTGQKNAMGQRYSVRNVLFEPFSDPTRDWASSAFSEIAQAFALRCPAIVSTHRVNYVGSMDQAHRTRSLRQLDELLTRVVRRWPTVEFITSDQLAVRMAG